jgi:hypothetical protein
VAVPQRPVAEEERLVAEEKRPVTEEKRPVTEEADCGTHTPCNRMNRTPSL